MFDDRDFETIMSEMMSNVEGNVRTDESSLIYNACSKIALKLEEAYGDMDEVNDNILPDTQDITHLIKYAKQRAIEYNYATAPVVKGTFSQEIEIGEQFTCSDYNYEVIEKIDDFNYRLLCLTEGTEANTNLGTLEPIEYIDEYAGGEITELLIAGTDDEDEEEFRQRVLDSFNATAFGGNRADYRLYIDAIAGVGGCKPKRRTESLNKIVCTIIGADFRTPSSELVNQVQTLVDPLVNQGEGLGIAPICHVVEIEPAESVVVNVSTSITFDDGYSPATSKQQIENAIDEYISELNSVWESNEFNNTTIRISQIEARILKVDGVLDIANTTLNGEAQNITLNYNQIGERGEVNVI